MKGKWTILALLCAAVLVYTLDRALLGVLAIPIQDETGISDIQFGVLNSAVFWAYAVCVPFAGLIGDRFDRRKIVAISIAVWSLMTVLAGFSCGFWTLLALVSVGITVPQTLYSPSANALIARVYRDSQATAMGFHQAAFYTGWLVSGSAVAALLAASADGVRPIFVSAPPALLSGLSSCGVRAGCRWANLPRPRPRRLPGARR